ncbi:MAG TPA: hypothetical protein VLC12_07740, partial [Terriglobales bacterium]|nr:hypothetical protein [Terriglobales bacterium]
MSYASGGDGGHGSSTRPARMRPRFLPTGSSSAGDPARGDAARELMESESSDLSEQQFAASLEASGRSSRPRFVPGAAASRRQSPERETPPPAENNTAAASEPEESFADPVPDNEAQFAAETPHHAVAEAPASASDFSPHPAALAGTASAVLEANPGTEDDGQGPQWRQEVAARLNHYHSRRTRKPPRYPSLALKFDPPVYSGTASTAPEPPRPLPSRSEAATAAATEPQDMEEACEVASDATNVIEFPRPLIPPPPRPDELAEPMLDLPRILDAPETVPKQVPLGGIILQSEEGLTPSDLELPLPVAPLNRRILAAALDGVLVGLATLMFAYIADKIAVLLPPLRVLLGVG